MPGATKNGRRIVNYPGTERCLVFQYNNKNGGISMKNQNQIQQFHSEEFGNVRVIEIDGEPWLVGKDVAMALGYSNVSKAVSVHIDEEDKKMKMIPHSQNGKLVSNTAIINESGLYSLILSSKLPTAKKFKRWVTSEILPTIRKHGAYATADTLDELIRSPRFAETLIRKLQAEREKNSALMDQVEALAPKAHYCDTILQCENALPVTLIAKDYGMTATAFNRLLLDLGIQFKVGGTWALRKKFSSEGYTQTRTYYAPGGNAKIHTCWTQKGRLFLYDALAWFGIFPVVETVSSFCDGEALQ